MSKPQGDQSDWSDKLVFSTGEAAQVCQVSQQTIIRCFDSGRLQGFRVPGSKFRRIPRDELIRFMRANDIPAARLDGRRRRVVCIVEAGHPLTELGGSVSPEDRLDVLIAESGFDAGWMCRDADPLLILIGPGIAAPVRRAVDQRYASDRPGRPAIVHVGEPSSETTGAVPDAVIGASDPLETVVERLVMLLDRAEANGQE